MVNNPGAVLGQFVGIPGSFPLRLNKATGITVTRGKVCKLDAGTSPDSWVTTSAAADQYGPFVIPTETVGTGVLKFSTRGNDIWYLKADGAIEPGSPVQASASTAGEVVAFVETTIDATPGQAELQDAQDDRLRQIGICLGKADNWNTGAPTAAADGDLVAVYVPFGGY